MADRRSSPTLTPSTRTGETEASFAVGAASRVLRRDISAGESGNVLHALPRRLEDLLSESE